MWEQICKGEKIWPLPLHKTQRIYEINTIDPRRAKSVREHSNCCMSISCNHCFLTLGLLLGLCCVCVHEEQLVKETRATTSSLMWTRLSCFKPAPGWLRVDTLLITACLCSSSCSLSRMTWISLARVPPLNHPGLNNSAFRSRIRLLTSPPPHPTPPQQPLSSVVAPPLWNACRWPQSPSSKGPNRICTYMQTKALLRKSKARGQRHKHTHTECEPAGPEGEIEWSSNVEEYWLDTAEQSESKWASAPPWECLASSHVGEHKPYRRSSSWCHEAFVCKKS